MDFEVVARAIRHCGRTLAVARGKSIHSHLIKLGVWAATYVANNLLVMYNDFGCYVDAQRVFDEMPQRNVVSWTASITAHVRAACALAQNLEFGRWIYRHMSGLQLQCDTVLMNAVLDMYIKCGSLLEARRIFDRLFMANTTSWNTMIGGYCGGDDMNEAEKLFHRVPEPDAVSYNTIIAGFSQLESPKALEFVSMMHKKGVMLDTFTFPCALKVCGSLGFEQMGKQIHCYVIKCGSEMSCFTGSSLIDMYANCGQITDSMDLYDQYLSCKEVFLDKLPLMNSMLSGFAFNRYDQHALDLVSVIHCSGIMFDAYTLSSALKVCINLQNRRAGLQVHSLIVKNGYDSDHVVGSILVDLYARCGNLEDAFSMFHVLTNKDEIAWTGLIAACVQQGSNQLAFSLFRDMTRVGVDHYAVSNILKACSALAWSQGGVQVHAYTTKTGLGSDTIVVASLVDMYSKSGHIEDGLQVFESAPEKDTICCTAMIAGCGYNGKSIEAIEHFQEMLKSGVKPNEITFLGVLSACRHGGLVMEACRIFKNMEDKHGIRPCLEHYCCMVDILSRAGKVEEAKQLISDMPYEPDGTIRNFLIRASSINQDIDLGKLYSVDLIPTCTHDMSGYVTLSNICASLGMWDVSANLREVIRRAGMKEAGKSWVAVRV
ncbi:pentatricopeptide repeat-containing protein At4g08210 isoform X2 [Typha angustifolia]|uniref:pentatricopeptide repeat-containing protein At4g08210 isoform X2 n=1 Tax=Typha angustifolia TaxID=59011 RepID=UPI003C2B1A26